MIYPLHKGKFHPGLLKTLNDKVCRKASQDVLMVPQSTEKQTALKKMLYSRRNRQIWFDDAASSKFPTHCRLSRKLEVVQYIQLHQPLTSPTTRLATHTNYPHHHPIALKMPLTTFLILKTARRHPRRLLPNIRPGMSRENARTDDPLRLTTPLFALSLPYLHLLTPRILLTWKAISRAYHGQKNTRKDAITRLTPPLPAPPPYHLNSSIP